MRSFVMLVGAILLQEAGCASTEPRSDPAPRTSYIDAAIEPVVEASPNDASPMNAETEPTQPASTTPQQPSESAVEALDHGWFRTEPHENPSDACQNALATIYRDFIHNLPFMRCVLDQTLTTDQADDVIRGVAVLRVSFGLQEHIVLAMATVEGWRYVTRLCVVGLGSIEQDSLRVKAIRFDQIDPNRGRVVLVETQALWTCTRCDGADHITSDAVTLLGVDDAQPFAIRLLPRSIIRRRVLGKGRPSGGIASGNARLQVTFGDDGTVRLGPARGRLPSKVQALIGSHSLQELSKAQPSFEGEDRLYCTSLDIRE